MSLQRRQRGQSMLEAIIATGILVTAISSALTLVTSSIKASKESEASITAGNLAREGIEVARAIRDSNWLAGRPFDDGLYAGTDYAGIAIFNPVANAWSIDFAAADAATVPAARVYRHDGTVAGTTLGLMVQAAAAPSGTGATAFSRIILAQPLCDNGSGGYTVVAQGSSCGAAAKLGMRVSTTVRWQVSGNTRTLQAVERMFDWR